MLWGNFVGHIFLSTGPILIQALSSQLLVIVALHNVLAYYRFSQVEKPRRFSE